MASGIAGPKAGTSRPEARKGKADPAAGVQRLRVMQLLLMQGVLALLLLGMAFVSRDDPSTMALFLWTLLVPAGFGFVYGRAYQRQEKARREGLWSRDWDKKETTRGYSALGGVFLLWIVGVLAILVLL